MRALLKPVGLSAAFAACLVLATVTFADPPPHAPAHGWRKKNDPYYVGYTGRQWERDYGILEGKCNREAIGTVLGAIAGGAIGSRVGEGSDRKVAIIVGSVLGAVIGRQIGRDMDERDRACVGHALELAKAGQAVRWTNEVSGVSYLLTPAQGQQKDNCRSYKLQISSGGKKHTQDGRACRAGDGEWSIPR